MPPSRFRAEAASISPPQPSVGGEVRRSAVPEARADCLSHPVCSAANKGNLHCKPRCECWWVTQCRMPVWLQAVFMLWLVMIAAEELTCRVWLASGRGLDAVCLRLDLAGHDQSPSLLCYERSRSQKLKGQKVANWSDSANGKKESSSSQRRRRPTYPTRLSASSSPLMAYSYQAAPWRHRISTSSNIMSYYEGR